MGFPALCRPNMADVVDPTILNMWSTFHENMIGGTNVKEGKNNVAFYIETKNQKIYFILFYYMIF